MVGPVGPQCLPYAGKERLDFVPQIGDVRSSAMRQALKAQGPASHRPLFAFRRAQFAGGRFIDDATLVSQPAEISVHHLSGVAGQ